MTATTPKMGLHYPTGTDRPCDGWQQLNTLSADIYAALNTIDTDLAKVRNLPMVSIAFQATIPQFIPLTTPDAPIVFNIVEQDDLQVADLIANNSGFTLGNTAFSEGTYIYGVHAIGNNTNASNFNPALMGIDVFLTPNTYNARAYDFDNVTNFTPGGGAPYGNVYVCGSALLPVPASTMLQAVRRNQGADMFIFFARLWAVRIGEA